MPSHTRAVVFGFASLVGVCSSCYFGDAPASDQPCTQAAQPDGGPLLVTGLLRDGHTKAPIPSAMIAVEYGGLYLRYPDLTRGSPYYEFGGVTDAKGQFTIAVRAGALGFHSFANGYLYSRAPLDTTKATCVIIEAEPVASTQKLPTVAGAAFDKTVVAAGTPVTFSATLATWASTDPLSDENILVEPSGSFGVELDPPSLGALDNFPDGVWTKTITAPATPGSYVYWFSATTAGCVTSTLVMLPLTVQ